MRRNYAALGVTFICMLFLFGCNGEVDYEKGFPSEDSPAFMEFMRIYLLNGNNELLKDNNTYIYSPENIDENLKRVEYIQVTEENLRSYYEPVLGAKDPQGTLKQLNKVRELEKTLYQPKDNQLTIKTAKNEKAFNLRELLEHNGIEGGSDYTVNIIEADEDHFVLTLEDSEKSGQIAELYYLFADHNLSNITITQLKPEETQDIIDSGQLKPYYDTFKSIDDNGDYKLLFNGVDVLNTVTNKVTRIKKDDYLSNDGKYVYLDGDKKEIDDGEQRIQALENYIKGNDKYEAEFKISFEKIAKELGLKTSGIGRAKTNYFNEDYIVLRLKYNGVVVGDAGSTNVIIDLQEDKRNPKAYLADLDIPASLKIY